MADRRPREVIVSPLADSSACNDKYGDRYGVDWAYPTQEQLDFLASCAESLLAYKLRCRGYGKRQWVPVGEQDQPKGGAE